MTGRETFLLFLGPAFALLSGLVIYKIGETPEERERLRRIWRDFVMRQRARFGG